MPSETLFEGSSLCIVGNINRDIKTSPVPAGERLLSDGETSVESLIETIGGGGANSALAARALGARVSFLGKVGVDYLATRLERTLKEHGVGAFLAKDPRQATGTSLALAFDTGQRHFVSCLPASQALKFDDLDTKALAGHEHLLRADIWFSESMLFEGNRQLLQTAREMNLVVSIDLNWDPLWGRASQEKIRARKNAVRAILPMVHLVHGNVRELTEFSDTSDLETALKCLSDWGAEAIVLHLGGRGAGYYCRGSLIVEPPASVKSQVNMTGTGDILSVCFMLLYRQLRVPIVDRLRLANRIVGEFIEGNRCLIPVLAD